jgi:MFS family permease
MSRTEHVPQRHPAAAPAHHQHPHAIDADPDQAQAGTRRSWAVLAVALAAQILVVLDISVVNTALPSIGASLGLAGSDLQPLITAYLVMSGGALLLGGRIADLLDRRRVFLTGLAVFTTASLFSGFADSGTQLTLTRALQGLSAALLTPAALSIIMTTYSGDQRKKGLVLWGAVGSLGVAAGVLVGGALTTWIGWQAIFWINVPVGVIALVVARSVVPTSTTERAGFAQFDIPGAVTVLGGLMALIWRSAAPPPTDGAHRAPSAPWRSPRAC